MSSANDNPLAAWLAAASDAERTGLESPHRDGAGDWPAAPHSPAASPQHASADWPAAPHSPAASPPHASADWPAAPPWPPASPQHASADARQHDSGGDAAARLPGSDPPAGWQANASPTTPASDWTGVAGGPRTDPWRSRGAWEEQHGEGGVVSSPRPRRFKRVWLLAAVPWLVALGLGAALLRAVGPSPLPQLPGPPSVTDDRAAGPPSGATPEEAPAEGNPLQPGPAPQQPAAGGGIPDGAVAAGGGTSDDAVATGGATGLPGAPMAPAAAVDGEVAAVAAAAVRLAVTRAETSDRPARYVDLATASAVDSIGELTVVTVLAVVLEGRGGAWDRVRTVRYAVAVADTASGPRPLSAPWVVSTVDAAPPPALEWTAELDDPALAAQIGDALAAAGYRDLEVVRLLRNDALPAGVLHATVHAVAPGEEHAGVHEVWMHAGDRVRLMGAPS